MIPKRLNLVDEGGNVDMLHGMRRNLRAMHDARTMQAASWQNLVLIGSLFFNVICRVYSCRREQACRSMSFSVKGILNIDDVNIIKAFFFAASDVFP